MLPLGGVAFETRCLGKLSAVISLFILSKYRHETCKQILCPFEVSSFIANILPFPTAKERGENIHRRYFYKMLLES